MNDETMPGVRVVPGGDLDDADPPGTIGAADPSGAAGRAGLDAVAVARAFADLASLGAHRYTRADAAQRLVDVAVDLLGVWAAGLLIDSPGTDPEVLAASTHEARLLELVQVRSGEGPCLEALRTGSVVVIPDVAAVADRWPTWHEGAVAVGVGSVCGIPLAVGDRSFAALNVFAQEPDAFGAERVEVLAALAQVTTLGMLQEQALAEATTLAAQLQGALDSRVLVEQAKGCLAERRGISVTEAFEILRRASRASARPMSEVARAVVDGDDLGGPGA